MVLHTGYRKADFISIADGKSGQELSYYEKLADHSLTLELFLLPDCQEY